MRSLTRRWNAGVTTVFVLMLLTADGTAERGTPTRTPSGGSSVFGDIEVTGAGAENKPLVFDILLYLRTGVVVDRQRVGSKGRYRFINFSAGDYPPVFSFVPIQVSLPN